MTAYHRIPAEAVKAARKAIAAASAANVPVMESLWRIASGVATRDDLVSVVADGIGDHMTAAAVSISARVAIAEELNDASDSETTAINAIAAMLLLGWERALQQAESRARTKLAKSRRRDELPFDGWPNPAVVAYLGADQLVHGQFEKLATVVGQSASELHDRLLVVAAQIGRLAGLNVEPPDDRADEIAAVVLATLRTRAMAYMSGQVQGLDQTVMARNIVAYTTHRLNQLPALLDVPVGDVTVHTGASWVEAVAGLIDGLAWDLEWRHAFFRIPETPFPAHVAMDGKTVRADQLATLGVWPGDHPFCTCALVRRWWSQ